MIRQNVMLDAKALVRPMSSIPGWSNVVIRNPDHRIAGWAEIQEMFILMSEVISE